ncbi:hypothetical protein LPJ61_000422 [Coemansia biformis]|uniref:BZIP domain-containing protein n=1 Tax=Coemansia biformis TaxID=1286918 RepID=A0A9W7YHX3_9FUNG|nr:hypothetical protein LPJ61_000422 [Coemansia biformis]
MSKPSEATAAVSGFLPAQAPTATVEVAPFPRLEPDQDLAGQVSAGPAMLVGTSAGDITAAATAAATAVAISTAMAEARLAVCSSGAQPMALVSQAASMGLHATVGGIPAVTAMAAADESVLASLQRNAHDQVMEMMNSYRSPHSHRRRSSVEAAAAASSVLASIANSTKPYMDSSIAAAVVAAANSQASIPPIGSYPGPTAQHAAAALLAASNMSSVVLPTIPSGTASLRNTPPPGQPGDHPGMADGSSAAVMEVSLPAFAVSAFNTLSPQSFAASEHLSASIAATSIGVPVSMSGPQLPLSAPIAAAPAELTAKPRKARRRRATSGASAAVHPAKTTAAASAGLDEATSSDDDDDYDQPLIADRMPLTPDAPGSGRPGSLRYLTADERRARRLQRNRLAAKECRQKKKVYIHSLEEHVSTLQDENARLRKEIKELNAKLTLGGMRASSSATTPVLEPRLPALPDYAAADMSAESLPSPTLAAKRPRVAVRSTSTGSNGNQP